MCLVTFSNKPYYSALKKLENFNGKPKWAYIEITDKCSHKCPWCYGEFPKNKKYSHISLSNFTHLLEICKLWGIKQITIGGGEPTEHPNFEEILRVASKFNFIIHIVSNGENINSKLADKMAECGVSQVQFNFQGKKFHDKIHGVKGCYEKLCNGMKFLKNNGIDVTTCTTVGKYNFDDILPIFKDALINGADRIRVWEAIGVGSDSRDGLSVIKIFKKAQENASILGYNHILSYDPEFQEGVCVNCIAYLKLGFHVNVSGNLYRCKVSMKDKSIGNFFKESSDDLLDKYLHNENIYDGTKCQWRK